LDIDGRTVMAHIANSGRMRELLEPGNRVCLAPAPENGRKTAFSLTLVDTGDTFVSVDARLPSMLVSEAVEAGRLTPFQSWLVLRHEIVIGESRLDLLLQQAGKLCYVETKSVTLVENGTGLFPDAPTRRGSKHLRSLAATHEAGHRAAAVFVIQREDCKRFSPNDVTDSDLGQSLRTAARAGVEVYAYCCHVDCKSIEIISPVEVVL
jgi:sugar fermentation stimulation protein A